MKIYMIVIFVTIPFMNCAKEVNIEGENNAPVGNGNALGDDAADTDATLPDTTPEITADNLSGGRVSSEVAAVAQYELKRVNPREDEFVGGDYCPETELRECFIKLGTMIEYENNTFLVSIELGDTSLERKYEVFDEVTAGKAPFLLLETPDYDVWAIASPWDLEVEIIRDYRKDGPRGDDAELIEILEFHELDQM